MKCPSCKYMLKSEKLLKFTSDNNKITIPEFKKILNYIHFLGNKVVFSYPVFHTWFSKMEDGG